MLLGAGHSGENLIRAEQAGRRLWLILLEIRREIWYNINPVSQPLRGKQANAYRPERQARGEPHVFVSADTRKKPLFTWKDKVLNLVNLHFDIVSTVRYPVENFVLRISDFAGLGTSTIVEDPLQIGQNMQNKANFQKSQMNVNLYNTKDYENISDWTFGENKPKQSQS